MAETLRQKQSRFTRMVADLIIQAYDLGYEATLGDAYRDPRVHGNIGERKSYSHPNSCHKIRLAIDLNLFKDGAYMDGAEGHSELGRWWKLQADDAAWGGDFGDFNHYSLEHGGMK